ncbi:metalloendoproteinase 5-MMP-like [Spinacia oleracea]|uniref:Metalloendoproteinase 5-MMP-like n=1 Tax=Spinacia oleracea TaxID=3562 RepID=A0ABM3R4F5_SPIOL|nr:metalloendoproteinase 5-MMP-like [Spinacia oleracea]
MAAKIYLVVYAIIMLQLSLVPHICQSKPIDSPFGFLNSLEGSTKGQENVDGLHQLKSYLAKFGYLENQVVFENDNLFDEKLEKAIKTYQRNYKLSVTGHLDGATITQMMKPRCGCPDIMNGRNSKRNKDETSIYKNRKSRNGTSLYVLGNTKWPPSKYNLTYKILSKTLVPGTFNMKHLVEESLKQWVEFSPFTFSEGTDGSKTDLVFGVARWNRGDGKPFDGPGGVLALSCFPTGGWSSYDATEKWSDDIDDTKPDQFDLYSVVLHEIGHLLGVAHSKDPTAVMFPTFGFGQKRQKLQPDDVQGIQALYRPN